ncbi:hypothetical protein LJB42_003076 [Komagataella kurtzmanii]|nr:hypothetical protein LJB42_003076 [Komagataella kurtzmanii]
MAPSTGKRLKGVSISRPIVYGNVAKPFGEKRPPEANAEHTHTWTVFVKDPQGKDLSYFIKKVVFKLHDTYPNSARTIESPPFQVTETGWGEFEIGIKIYFVPESNEKNVSLYHNLKLHPYGFPPGHVLTDKDREVQSILYDEIVFNEPTERMFEILTKTPGSLLPPVGNNKYTFSKKMENDELDRIKQAMDKVIEEINVQKDRLKELEAEREKLVTVNQ